MSASSRFVVGREEVAERCKTSGLTPESLIATLVEPTRELARPPISNFHVGAVGLGGSTGRAYRGVNLEFPGVPLNQSVHAEQFVVAHMAHHGETCLAALAVSAAPCGHCRQFLQEVRGAGEIHVCVVDGESVKMKTPPGQRLIELLPHRFGPDDLLAQDSSFLYLLEPRNNRLVLLDGASPVSHSHAEKVTTSNGSLACSEGSSRHRYLPGREHHQGVDKKVISRLKEAALQAANKSYAPYSSCPSGVAILIRGSEVFAGSYLESAAYNPSLGPLQAGIVAFVASGGGSYEEFEYVVLVERFGGKVQQAGTVRLVLDEIAPRCPLLVFYVGTSSDSS